MSERDELQAQTAEEARQASAQAAMETLTAADHTAALRRRWIEEMVSHVIALMLTLGFFLLAFCVLLGKVDITNPAVATMVGTIIGLAAAKIDPLLFRYYKAVPQAEPATKPSAAPVESAVRPPALTTGTP